MRFVCAEGDGDGNRARADGERQSERIESFAEKIAKVDIAVDVLARAILFILVEHFPAGRHDDQASADLHDGNRNAEEGEDMRAYEKGADEEKQAIDGDAAGKEFSLIRGVVVGERKENGGAAQGIHDGEERGDNEKTRFGDVKHFCPGKV